MGLIKIDAPYVEVKKSGYYFTPRNWIAEFVQPQPLGTDPVKAAEKARELYRWASEAREEKALGKQAVEGSLAWLIQEYKASLGFTRLKTKTQIDYTKHLKMIEAWSGDKQVKGVTPKSIEIWYHKIYKRTPYQANATLRVFRVLLERGIMEKLVSDNAARRVSIMGQPPRQQVWTDRQVEDVIQAAKDKGLQSMALAVRLAADTGQRQGDVISMVRSAEQKGFIRLAQSKRGASIAVKITSELRDEIDATPKAGVQFVVYEATGTPYTEHHFRHVFREVADAAGLPKDIQYRDLRRYAVLQLARAGCTQPQIAAITGHSEKTVGELLRVYLPRDGKVAGAAIDKLEAYRKGTKGHQMSENSDNAD